MDYKKCVSEGSGLQPLSSLLTPHLLCTNTLRDNIWYLGSSLQPIKKSCHAKDHFRTPSSKKLCFTVYTPCKNKSNTLHYEENIYLKSWFFFHPNSPFFQWRGQSSCRLFIYVLSCTGKVLLCKPDYTAKVILLGSFQLSQTDIISLGLLSLPSLC